MPSVERQPPFEQIASHYRELIRRRQLTPGDELPAVRGLAELWSVAPNTAARAVASLRDGGWIETRPGRPSVVAASPPE